MYELIKKKYAHQLRDLISLSSESPENSMELACLFGEIAQELRNLGETTDDLRYLTDAAVHYQYAISISSKFLGTSFINKEFKNAVNSLHRFFTKQITGSDEILLLHSKDMTQLGHKEYLLELRDEVKSKIEEIQLFAKPANQFDTRYVKASKDLFDHIHDRMKIYLTLLIDEVTEVIGSAPCRYSVMGMGSMALRHMTPYSDLEFAILTENDDYKLDPKTCNYFKHLAHYVHFKIIGLNETIIPTSLYDINLESLVSRAVNFDLGGKTPLGRADKDYELIGTVESIFRYCTGDYEVDNEERRDAKLKHVLELVCYICGNEAGYEGSLVQQYQKLVYECINSLNSSGISYGEQRAVNILMAGTKTEASKKFDVFNPEMLFMEGNLFEFGIKDRMIPESKLFDVKQEIYRLPDRFIYNLCLIYGIPQTINGLSAFDIVNYMSDKGMLLSEAARHLNETIAFANLLRLRIYDYFGKQKESMEVLPYDAGVENANFRLSTDEIAEGGALFNYYYTTFALTQKLIEFCAISNESPSSSQRLGFFSDTMMYESGDHAKSIIYLRMQRLNDALYHQERYLSAIADSPLMIQLGMYTSCADTCTKLGNYSKALEYQQSILSLLQDHQHDKDISPHAIPLIYMFISNTLRALGEYSGSLEYQTKAVELLESNSLLTCVYNMNFGIKLHEAGKYAEALEYQIQSLPSLLETLGEGNIVARCYSHCSLSYAKLGKYTQALEHAKRALDIQKKILSEEHIEVLVSYNNLGMIYSEMGDQKNALKYSYQSLFARLKLFDENHPYIAASYNNLGLMYNQIGQKKKALLYLEKACKIQQKIFPENHPDVLVAYNNLGMIYSEMGDQKNALKYGEKTLVARLELFGEHHPYVAASYNNIACAYRYLGQYEKAIMCYEKALDIDINLFGTKHPSVTTTLHNMATLFYSKNDYSTAFVYSDTAVSLALEVYEKSHPILIKFFDHHTHICLAFSAFNTALLSLQRPVGIHNTDMPSIIGDDNEALGVFADITRDWDVE